MLLLTSATDLLQVQAQAAGSPTSISLDVHASWVNNNAGTITPDRKNTSITSEALTTVVTSPVAGQHNVQTLTVRNKHASDPAYVTVRHTDGSTPVELPKVLLSPGDLLQFLDGVGFSVIDGNGQVKVGAGFSQINVQDFSASGTYTPSTGMKWCIVLVTGAGGGGGGSDTSLGGSGDVGVGGGGGAGETRIGFFSKAQIGVNQTITINAVGTAGSATNGTNGGNGGNAVFGALITAIGGTGGTGSAAGAQDTQSSNGGAGGTGGTGGTVVIAGGQGSNGLAFSIDGTTDTSSGLGGDGAPSMWGGGGRGGNTGSVTLTNAANVAGNNGPAPGSGGGGAITTNSTTGAAGGTGGSGKVMVIEFG